MHEFPQIPYPFPNLPEETYVDEKGRIWFSRWSYIGFLEHYYATPEEERMPTGAEGHGHTKSGKRMMSFTSNA